MTATQVDTKKIQDRRVVNFHDMHDIAADVDFLDDASLAPIANWTPAQNLEHVTRLIEASLDGFDFDAPWYVKLGVKVIGGRLLTKGFPAGLTPPKGAEKLIPGDDVTWADARDHFRSVMARLDRGAKMNMRSPLFGEMTHEKWVQVHCRHAELHLGFVRVR